MSLSGFDQGIILRLVSDRLDEATEPVGGSGRPILPDPLIKRNNDESSPILFNPGTVQALVASAPNPFVGIQTHFLTL